MESLSQRFAHIFFQFLCPLTILMQFAILQLRIEKVEKSEKSVFFRIVGGRTKQNWNSFGEVFFVEVFYAVRAPSAR